MILNKKNLFDKAIKKKAENKLIFLTFKRIYIK